MLEVHEPESSYTPGYPQSSERRPENPSCLLHKKKKWRPERGANQSIFTSELTRKNAIVEYLDYQIPATQLNRDMQVAKRD